MPAPPSRWLLDATWPAVAATIERLEAVSYALCTNGIEVFERNGDLINAQQIEPEIVRDAIARLRAAIPGVALGLGWRNQMHIEDGITSVMPPDVAHPRLVDNISSIVSDGIRDVVVFHPDYQHDLDTLFQLCADALPIAGLDIAYTGLPMIELVPPGAGKDTGLAWLSDHVGIDQGNVVAFGDGLNDLAMLGWAGVGVAMGQSVATVIEAADEVTESVDKHGVAVWLEQRLP